MSPTHHLRHREAVRVAVGVRAAVAPVPVPARVAPAPVPAADGKRSMFATKRWLSIAAALLLCGLFLAGAVAPVRALDYLFRVEKEQVNVYWNEDGTLSLDYLWVFANSAGAHPIDFVDVGLPNDHFELSRVKAEVDGTPVTVSRDDYQGSGSGFAVVMAAKTIPAGGRGIVHVSVESIAQVLYPDGNDKAYVSARFSPTWFGSQYVTGETDLMVVFHFPPSVKANQPRYHGDVIWVGGNKPDFGQDVDGRRTYTWHSANALASAQYTLGASFPRESIPVARTVSPPQTVPVMSDLFVSLVMVFLLVAYVAFLVWVTRRNKLQYLPPKISIEGHGIKRGLTAVEAAILMGEPFDRILTMMLFSTLRKGALQITSRNPLELKVSEHLPGTLRFYEKVFLEALTKEHDQFQKDLQALLVKMVKNISNQMKGFSRQESIDYYKGVYRQAWEQVRAAGTPELTGQAFDKNLEWLLLDKDYERQARQTFTGPVLAPEWWSRYDAAAGGASQATVPAGSTNIGLGPLPGADFAAGLVGGIGIFSGNLLGDLVQFTDGVRQVTNPTILARRYGGWGGHGGACACAGCACACAGCACACAGGGR